MGWKKKLHSGNGPISRPGYSALNMCRLSIKVRQKSYFEPIYGGSQRLKVISSILSHYISYKSVAEFWFLMLYWPRFASSSQILTKHKKPQYIAMGGGKKGSQMFQNILEEKIDQTQRKKKS